VEKYSQSYVIREEGDSDYQRGRYVEIYDTLLQNDSFNIRGFA